MCATSIQNARKLAEGIKESAQRQAVSHGILIGGLKKRPVVFSEQQRQQLSEIYPGVSIPFVGDTFRSFFAPNHGDDGKLYRVDEDVVVKYEGHKRVAHIICFWLIQLSNTHNRLFECKFYDIAIDENGLPLRDEYSGHILLGNISNELVMLNVNAIRQKVMIYHHDVSKIIAIDHERPRFPLIEYDVVVPFYAVKGDMVLVNGSDNEIWLAHVIFSDENRKTARIKYYEKDPSDSDGLHYVVEGSEDQIEWDCIITSVKGDWSGNRWKCDTNPL